MTVAQLERAVWRSGVLVSFLLSLVACAAVLVVRVSHGGPLHTWLMSALVALAAIVCARSIDVLGGPRPARVGRRAALAAAYAIGAIVAVASVHLAVALRGAALDAVLREGPAQLANDAVLVGGMLGLCWSLGASSRLVRVGLPVACLALVGAYLSTAPRWHLDAFPGLAVQHAVAAQTLAIAGALALFDVLRPRDA